MVACVVERLAIPQKSQSGRAVHTVIILVITAIRLLCHIVYLSIQNSIVSLLFLKHQIHSPRIINVTWLSCMLIYLFLLFYFNKYIVQWWVTGEREMVDRHTWNIIFFKWSFSFAYICIVFFFLWADSCNNTLYESKFALVKWLHSKLLKIKIQKTRRTWAHKLRYPCKYVKKNI